MVRRGVLASDGLVSLWSYCDGRLALASRTLNFLCQNQYGPVRISESDYCTLEEDFQHDEAVRYSWDCRSFYVESIARKLRIHAASVDAFLDECNFDSKVTSNPRRKRRDEWIESVWTRVPEQPNNLGVLIAERKNLNSAG